MLQFVIGSSGSGKSTYIYQKVIAESQQHPERTYLIIVPEQFTLQTQKELVMLHPNKGIMNIDVLSFLRLAFRVFEELGTEKGMVLEDMGKSLIVKKVLMEQKDNLQHFAGSVRRQKFAEEMKSVLSELFQYGVDEETLDRMEHAADTDRNPILKRKMHDIALVCRAFKEFLCTRYITAEEIFDLLSRELAESSILRNAVVVLDGFTGFTPSQHRLLQALMRYADRVIVTITMDRREAERVLHPVRYQEHRLFYTGYKTMETLRSLAAEVGCKVEDNELLPNQSEEVPYRFRSSSSLAHLERNIFRYPHIPFEADTKSIQLWNCATPQEEVYQTACEIKRLVREGMRYQDIAVITGDMASYGDLLVRCFDEARIPAFTDQKRSILTNPLVELIRALLELSEGNLSYEQVFRWCKCALSGIETEECDRLENYVLACGIHGRSSWERNWTRVLRQKRKRTASDSEQAKRQEEELASINEVRSRVMEQLLPVLSILQNQNTDTMQRIAALRQYLADHNIKEKLTKMTDALEQSDDFGERLSNILKKEYEQVWQQVEDVFSRAEELLGKDILTTKEFREIMETGFSEAKVGLIPPGRDQVVIGDIERTRLQGIKVLFFLGVNEGAVPASKDSGGILSDSDREFFLEQRIELAPTRRQLAYTTEYYLYLNLTKPGERLYISYTRKDAEGKPKRPSYLIGKLKGLFPNMEIQEPAKRNDAQSILGTDFGRTCFLKELRACRDGENYGPTVELMLLLKEQDAGVEDLIEKVFYRSPSQALRAEQAAQLYGEVLRGSVTRLESYAQCAMRFFLEYGMELEEREVYQLSMPELGSIFHRALECFAKRVQEDRKVWSELDEEERKKYADEATTLAVEEYKNEKLTESDERTRYMIERVGRTMQRTVATIQEQLKNSRLEPKEFEADFHYQEEGLDFYGKIDRIDFYEEEERCYIRITDYKSGSTKLDLNKVFHGLQLQLGLYLDAVMTELEKDNPEKEIIAAAMLYYHIQDPIVERTDFVEEKILKELRPNGLVNENPRVLKYLDSELVPVVEETENPYEDKFGLKPGQNANLLPVRTKANGEPYASSSLASQSNLQDLRIHLKKTVQRFRDEIAQGRAEANPYCYGMEEACTYCNYQSVCSFGILSGKMGRNLKKIGADEIWQIIGQRNKSK